MIFEVWIVLKRSVEISIKILNENLNCCSVLKTFRLQLQEYAIKNRDSRLASEIISHFGTFTIRAVYVLYIYETFSVQYLSNSV